jgi:23S rRNA (guanosine2251-2'-O)-methyltransferase
MKKLIVYGRHTAKSLLSNDKRKIEKILCTNNTIDLVPDNFKGKTLLIDKITIDKYLEKNSIYNCLHQDIVIETQELRQPSLYEIAGNSQLVVLLDQLQDSQNIGAIIRSAALFNIDAIISTLHNSPQENSHILKAASGAFEMLPFIKVVNLVQAIETLKNNNYWLIGMSCNCEESLYTITNRFTNKEKIAIVIGNEENGMRKSTEKHCDFLVKIPIASKVGIDSLNASNAAAIFFYEISKIFSLNT